jgi:uncharacterized membrane protein
MPNPTKNNPVPSPNRHRVRKTFSVLCGIFAVALILASILGIWLDRTISDTDQYTKTVAPLVADPDVQAFVAEEVGDTLLDNKDVPITEIAVGVLGPAQVVGKSDEQLRAEVSPIVNKSLQTVIASPAFASLWKASNGAIHAQLIQQLKSDSPLIELNFQPLVADTIAQLGTTELAPVQDQLKIEDDAGKITIEDKQLDTARNVYNAFHKAMLAIIILAIVFVALCIGIAVDRWKAVRRLALFTGIIAAILALLLSLKSVATIGGEDVLEQKFATALIDGVTHDLRIALIIIAVLGIGSAIGWKVYRLIKASKQATPK